MPSTRRCRHSCPARSCPASTLSVSGHSLPAYPCQSGLRGVLKHLPYMCMSCAQVLSQAKQASSMGRRPYSGPHLLPSNKRGTTCASPTWNGTRGQRQRQRHRGTRGHAASCRRPRPRPSHWTGGAAASCPVSALPHLAASTTRACPISSIALQAIRLNAPFVAGHFVCSVPPAPLPRIPRPETRGRSKARGPGTKRDAAKRGGGSRPSPMLHPSLPPPPSLHSPLPLFTSPSLYCPYLIHLGTLLQSTPRSRPLGLLASPLAASPLRIEYSRLMRPSSQASCRLSLPGPAVGPASPDLLRLVYLVHLCPRLLPLLLALPGPLDLAPCVGKLSASSATFLAARGVFLVFFFFQRAAQIGRAHV